MHQEIAGETAQSKAVACLKVPLGLEGSLSDS